MRFSDPEPRAQQAWPGDQRPAPRQAANQQYGTPYIRTPAMKYPARPAASVPTGFEAAYYAARADPRKHPARPAASAPAGIERAYSAARADPRKQAARQPNFDPHAFAAANNFLGGEPRFAGGPRPAPIARKPVEKAPLPQGVTMDPRRALGVARPSPAVTANGNDRRYLREHVSGRSEALNPKARR